MEQFQPAVNSGLLWQTFQGEAFDSAIQGYRDENKRIVPPTHRVPDLRYYHPRSVLLRLREKTDPRLFFAVSSEPQPDNDYGVPTRCFVALLEIETSPYDANELWLMYVSVDPAYKRSGLAKKLLTMLTEHVRGTGQCLVVSKPSDECREGFLTCAEQVLNDSGIAWRYSL